MVNEKTNASNHEMLGDLIKFLIAQECYVTITQTHKEGSDHTTIALVYETHNQQIEAVPKWTVISHRDADYLIVDGDITPSGLPVVVKDIKEIISMYNKWVNEDRPWKVFSLTTWTMGINPYITREADSSEGELAPLPEIEEEKE